jgi:hypothetical protein
MKGLKLNCELILYIFFIFVTLNMVPALNLFQFMPKKYSLDKDKIKVVLLEGIHKNAAEFFLENGYTNIESLPNTPDDVELREIIQSTNIIGIR